MTRADYRSILGFVLFWIAGAALAQAPALPAVSAQLSQAELDLRAVDRALDGRVEEKDRAGLRAKAVAAQASAASTVGPLEDQLAQIEARVEGLGPVAADAAETSDIKQQRARLGQQRTTIDAALKRGRLVDIEARQLITEIDRSQAEQFEQRISTQSASPLTPAFWRNIAASFPRDLRRVHLFTTQGVQQIEAKRRGLPWQPLVGVVLALVILFPVRIAVRRAGRRFLIEGAPGHRLRRSANALLRMLIGTLSPLLAATALVQGLRWGGMLPERWSGVLDAFILASGFAGFTVSSAGALLMRGQPSWRVAPFDDLTATRLRPLSWMLAVLSFASILLSAFNVSVGASAAAEEAFQATFALLHLLLIAGFLFVLGRLRAECADSEDAGSLSTSAGLGAVTLGLWLLVGVALVAVLLGYINLGLFIGQLITWAAVLGTALYLLMVAADDVTTSVFSRHSRFGSLLSRGFGVRGSRIDQLGLLLSGSLRLMLIILALGLLLSPFGAGGGLGSVFGRLGLLAQGIQVGGISISPGAILRGLIVLSLGLGLVRWFMGWLETRYLPVTDLDGNGRNSVSLVARYVGIALAVIWALASLGIGVERIALLLSALSVGIGFGLQAITQNFVSGLILLAERPIKIGDLVRVGSDEGDVKRISVRSTEIELADHSTLIVPNSELITKSVLNKTLAGPLGRIQIQFSVPIGTDADSVRGIVLDAFVNEPAVLDDPAPSVFVDAINDGRILFNCFGHVASPRAAYGPRSNILMALLRRFREEGIDIGTVPQRLEMVAPDHPPIQDNRLPSASE